MSIFERLTSISIIVALLVLPLRAEPTLSGVLQSFYKDVHQISNFHFYCEGHGLEGIAAHAPLQPFTTAFEVWVNKNSVKYTAYKFLVNPVGGKILRQPMITTQFGPTDFQVMDYDAAIMSVSKKPTTDMQSFNYSGSRIAGIFEPYLFAPLAWRWQKNQANPPSILKNRENFFPTFMQFDSEDVWDTAAKTGAVLSNTAMVNGLKCLEVKFPQVRFDGRETYCIVDFAIDKAYLPIKWELFYSGPDEKYLNKRYYTFEGKLSTIRNIGSFQYFEEYTTTYYLINTQGESFNYSTCNFKISGVENSKALDSEDFMLDPSLARRIWDLDSDKWIAVPR